MGNALVRFPSFAGQKPDRKCRLEDIDGDPRPDGVRSSRKPRRDDRWWRVLRDDGTPTGWLLRSQAEVRETVTVSLTGGSYRKTYGTGWVLLSETERGARHSDTRAAALRGIPARVWEGR